MLFELLLVIGEGPVPDAGGAVFLSGAERLELAKCVSENSLGIAVEFRFVEDFSGLDRAAGQGVAEPVCGIAAIFVGILDGRFEVNEAWEEAGGTERQGQGREDVASDGGDRGDAGVTGAGGIKARAHDVGECVFGREEDDAAGLVGCFGGVGPGGAGGKAGGEVECEQAFADGGLSEEEREFSEWQPVGP